MRWASPKIGSIVRITFYGDNHLDRLAEITGVLTTLDGPYQDCRVRWLDHIEGDDKRSNVYSSRFLTNLGPLELLALQAEDEPEPEEGS